MWALSKAPCFWKLPYGLHEIAVGLKARLSAVEKSAEHYSNYRACHLLPKSLHSPCTPTWKAKLPKMTDDSTSQHSTIDCK